MFFNAKQANLQVELDNRGRVEGIRHHGVEFAFPAEEMFTMLLLDKNANELLLKSSEFDGTIWSGHWLSATLKVVFSADAGEKFVRFRPQVTGIPPELTLGWFDGPQLIRNLTTEAGVSPVLTSSVPVSCYGSGTLFVILRAERSFV